MAIRNNLKQSRATIEKIRESIDTDLAVKTLATIMNDSGLPPTVRVKAASVLLDKTMPSLTASDITTHEPESTMEQKFQALVNQVGPDKARMIYPDLAAKYLGEPKKANTDAPKAVQ